MNTRLISRVGAVTLVAVITGALLAGCATGHPTHVTATHAEVLKRMERAHTAADYQSLAQFFTAEAATARTMATEHRNMTQVYSPGPGGNGSYVALRPGLEPSRHCQALADLYQQAADEDMAMVRIYDQMAAGASGSN